MRVLRKMIVLGLAALGLYKAWEMVSPRIDAARDKTAKARDRVEPALRDATHTVQSATKDAAGTLLDASREAADSLAGAVSDTENGSSTAETGASSGSGTTVPTPSTERANFGG